MTIMITGGAGYIGSHVAKLLASNHLDIVVFDNFSEGYPEAVKWCSYVRGDLRDPEQIEPVLKRHDIEGIMHFAAKCLVGESMEKPNEYYDNNLHASFHLLSCAVKHKVRNFIFSSTCAAYGTPDHVPISEQETPKPISIYGRSKYFFEIILADFAGRYDLNYVCFRYFNAAGADKDGETGEKHDPETHLIPRVIDVGLADEALSVFGKDYPTPDGTCVRDYLNVEDIARAHLKGYRFLEKERRNEVFNLGCGKGYSVMEIIAKVEEVLGKKVEYRIEDRRAGDPPVLIADYAKAKRILHWEPERSDLKTIVETAAKWRMSKEYERFVRLQ